MRITPFEVLEQNARDEYRRRFAHVPEPKVVNARPLLQLDAMRSLVWGGVGYWAPPLSFEAGSRLMAVSSYLTDALRQGKESAARDAVRTAAPILRDALRPTLPSRWRPLKRLRVRAMAAVAFVDDAPEDVLSLTRWLLHVEDESPVVPSDRQGTIDLIDARYSFEDRFGRAPRSWKDYVYGMRYIGRASNREDLRGAVSTRIGVNADAKGWKEYEREIRSLAGWSHG